MKNFENILVSNPGRIASDEMNDIRTAIDLVITSGQYIGGKFVKNFEDEFAEYLGAHQNVISTACGQDALQLALTSLEIEPQGLVVVPPTASADNQIRGNHTTDCNEFVVLLIGKATFFLNIDGIDSEIQLNLRGNNIYINKGTFVRYNLNTIGSTILVLSDSPYHLRRSDE